MAIPVTCKCGKAMVAKDEHAGRKMQCGSCKAIVEIPTVGVTSVPLPFPAPAAGVPNIRPPAADPSKVWEYKVLTQKDKWFSGKFDPERLEAAMNSYAKQGWRVMAVTTASIAGFGGNRDEMIVVLER